MPDSVLSTSYQKGIKRGKETYILFREVGNRQINTYCNVSSDKCFLKERNGKYYANLRTKPHISKISKMLIGKQIFFFIWMEMRNNDL